MGRATKEEYITQWFEHIDDLNRIGFNCSAQDWERVKELKKDLKEIVLRASEAR